MAITSQGVGDSLAARSHAGLLLGLGGHPVELGGLKVAQRVELDVGRDSRLAPELSQGVAHGVGVGRCLPPGSEEKDKGVVGEDHAALLS